MKLWSSDFTFHAPWKQTSEAVWKKYPNPQQPNVAHIDVLERRVTKDGKLLTTRLFGSHFSFPTLVTKILGLPEICYAIELSEVDPKTQKMTLRMINYTFGSVLAVDEKLVYTPSQQNPNETILEQTAMVHINGIPFSNYFEDMLVTKFEATAKLGRQAIQNMLKKITIENILAAVKKELSELSIELDNAATKLDNEFNITQRISELSNDLERAAVIFNSELQSFSEKLQTEILAGIKSLDLELSQVVVKVKLSGYEGVIDGHKIGLSDAITNAGITAITANS